MIVNQPPPGLNNRFTQLTAIEMQDQGQGPQGGHMSALRAMLEQVD